MIKHILVPIDFSDICKAAVKEAAKIARYTGADVTLLHAYLIPGYSGGMAYESFIPPIDEHIEMINKQIEDFAKSIPELKDVKINQAAVPGAVQDMIGSYVEDNDIDLVISGTRGASGFLSFLIGSHSERIESEVECPVLIITEEFKPTKGMKIALAHDYKSQIDSSKQKILHFFMDFYKSTLHVVHVEEKDDTPDAETSVRENLQELNATFHKVVHDNVEKGLNDFVQQNSIGMLSIIYHDHNFLYSLFGKSTSRQLTYHTKIPLLVLK